MKFLLLFFTTLTFQLAHAHFDIDSKSFDVENVNEEDSLCDDVQFVNGKHFKCYVESFESKVVLVSLCTSSDSKYEINRDSVATINGLTIEEFRKSIESRMSKEENAKEREKVLEEEEYSDQFLLIESEKKKVEIKQGKKVTIKANGERYKGKLRIINDSTLNVKGTNIILKDVDMIASPKRAKSIGLFFAALPIEFTGLVLIAGGQIGDAIIGVGGAATMLVGIIAAGVEGSIGKRYSKLTKDKNDGSAQETKNKYSIQNL